MRVAGASARRMFVALDKAAPVLECARDYLGGRARGRLNAAGTLSGRLTAGHRWSGSPSSVQAAPAVPAPPVVIVGVAAVQLAPNARS